MFVDFGVYMHFSEETVSNSHTGNVTPQSLRINDFMLPPSFARAETQMFDLRD